MKHVNGKLTLSHTQNSLSNLIGTEASDVSTHISTRRGTGNVSVPHLANTVAGFEFFTMVKHELDSVAYWIPAYREQSI